ncbi:MAG TPA: short chain dehydrogenase, partial [Kofleriaceae bacterium]|nr:short chain dehydrogenase [Kofleriaceae bacterium]
MRIIVIGGAGAVGRSAVAALSGRHEIVVAGRSSGAVRVDIRSADSVRAMYEEIGRFDALVSAAGDAHLGPFDTMSEADLAVGIESKLLGQIRLVLLGRERIADGGSFTLMSGYIFDDPIRGSSSYAAANGGVEGFVRAAALDLSRGVRINAVSPGMAEDTAAEFGR